MNRRSFLKGFAAAAIMTGVASGTMAQFVSPAQKMEIARKLAVSDWELINNFINGVIWPPYQASIIGERAFTNAKPYRLALIADLKKRGYLNG